MRTYLIGALAIAIATIGLSLTTIEEAAASIGAPILTERSMTDTASAVYGSEILDYSNDLTNDDWNAGLNTFARMTIGRAHNGVAHRAGDDCTAKHSLMTILEGGGDFFAFGKPATISDL